MDFNSRIVLVLLLFAGAIYGGNAIVMLSSVSREESSAILRLVSASAGQPSGDAPAFAISLEGADSEHENLTGFGEAGEGGKPGNVSAGQEDGGGSPQVNGSASEPQENASGDSEAGTVSGESGNESGNGTESHGGQGSGEDVPALAARRCGFSSGQDQLVRDAFLGADAGFESEVRGAMEGGTDTQVGGFCGSLGHKLNETTANQSREEHLEHDDAVEARTAVSDNSSSEAEVRLDIHRVRDAGSIRMLLEQGANAEDIASGLSASRLAATGTITIGPDEYFLLDAEMDGDNVTGDVYIQEAGGLVPAGRADISLGENGSGGTISRADGSNITLH